MEDKLGHILWVWGLIISLNMKIRLVSSLYGKSTVKSQIRFSVKVQYCNN